MQITRSSIETQKGPDDWFTGNVYIDAVAAPAGTSTFAAANVHFTPATIGGWARAGKLSSIKLGGKRFVRRGEVRALLAAPRRVRAEDLQPGLFEDLP